MAVVHAAQLAASGYIVIARHPWLSGRLAEAARQLGIAIPSDALLLRIPPPWAKTRGYLSNASLGQLRAMSEFGKVAAETAGRPVAERLVTIRERLAGKTYGRMPKYKAPRLPAVNAELAKKSRTAQALAVAQM